jgi:malate-CoA ligase subunit alpha
MSILTDKHNAVIVQGMTGEYGTFYTDRMLEYGTRVVGGVTPAKGGTEHLGLPVFDTVAEAVSQTSADTSVIFDSSPFAADSIMEAADAGIKLCVCVTGGIPAQDMIRVKRYIRSLNGEQRMILIGPGSAGIISPGKALAGIMPGYLYQPGNIGIIVRSGTLGFEAASQF